MTATILLVRHAAHAELGKVLSGRTGDVPLSGIGVVQARALGQRIGGGRLDAVQTSPVRRARETADSIAAPRGLSAEIAPPLDEIDFGEWSGKRFAELDGDPLWARWNAQRSAVTPPGGEPMRAVQSRVIAHLRQVASDASGMVVAMVTHADVIRAAVAGILGLALDRILGFDIDPASITRLEAGDWGERLVSLNERAPG